MAKGVGGWIENPADFEAAAGGIKYIDKAGNAALFGTPGADGTRFQTVTDALQIWQSFDKVTVTVAPADIIDQTMYGG